MKILVVDDERIILRGIARMIREHPDVEEVRTAEEAEEALEILKEFRADAVITDIRMPETDGLELIRRAEAEGLCRRFVILSGYSDFEYARTAIRYHVMDYLLKPVDPDDLNRVLGEILSELAGGNPPAEETPPASLKDAVAAALSEDGLPAVPASGKEKPEFFPEDDAGRILARILDSLYSRESFSPLVKPALLRVIRSYADSSLDLGQIAEELYVNANYLSGIISSETGVSFYAFLRTYRVAAAKEALLSAGRPSIRTVAEQCGFGTENNFFRTFKQLTGKTPREYRESNTPKEEHHAQPHRKTHP